MPRRPSPLAALSIALLVAFAAFAAVAAAERTQKPPLHGQALDGDHRQAARARPPAR